MKSTAYVLSEPGQAEFIDLDLPELAADEMLVKVVRTGICGTDLHIADGELGTPYPVVPGHEFVGKVHSASDATLQRRGLRIGDHVAVEMLIPCEKCRPCREGRYNLCVQDDRSLSPEGRQYGINIPADYDRGFWGGFAEHLIVPPNARVHVIPQGMSWTRAALVEPMAVAVRIVNRAEARPGQSVAIFGPGPIGILTTLVAHHRGIENITVIGTRESRLQLARTFGATNTLKNSELTDDSDPLADVVIETAGRAEAQEAAIRATATGGVAVLAGACGMDVPVTFKQDQDVLLKEIDIRGSFLSAGGYEEALQILRDTPYEVEELVTHVYPFEDLPLAFNELRDKSIGIFKAHIHIEKE